MKLSQLLSTHKVTSTGFPAIAGLGAHSTGDTPAVLSALSAPVLWTQGVTNYYTLVLPRGTQFNTPEDIFAADPEVKQYRIAAVDTTGLPKVITTQHQATLDLLAELYPDAELLEQRQADGSPRNLSAADVAGKHVIGVLPPFLIAVAGAFTSASIDKYNAVTDGDLAGDELRDRLRIAEQAITVKEV